MNALPSIAAQSLASRSGQMGSRIATPELMAERLRRRERGED